MTEEQANILGDIIQHISQPHPQPILLRVMAGRGETFIINALGTKIRAEGEYILLSGQSALASSNYERGRTVHDLFSLPVSENHEGVESHVLARPNRADLLVSSKAIVVNEVSSLHKLDSEACDRLSLGL